jgi:hypothetical protein
MVSAFLIPQTTSRRPSQLMPMAATARNIPLTAFPENPLDTGVESVDVISEFC